MKKSSHHFFLLIGISIIFLLSSALYLGFRSAQEIKYVVTEQFNNQQLILARQASREIEENFRSLVNELFTLKEILNTIQLSPKQSHNFLQEIYHNIKGLGASGIIVFSKDGELIFKKGVSLPMSTNDLIRSLNHSKPMMIFYKRPWIYIVSLMDHRYTFFVVDSTAFVRRHVDSIRSGKTGYAWIIDNKGCFVYHPINSFIGQEAIKIRKERAPMFAFWGIDKVQDEMLRSQEGTGEYTSPWHRGQKGFFKKIVAFTPIYLPYSNLIFSVAVCAPENEVNSLVKYAYIRQLSIQGAIIFAIVLISLGMVWLERRFRETLQQEVDIKEAGLKKSEGRYRLVLEAADDLIFTMDLQGRILSFNQATIEFSGKKPDELEGLNFVQLMKWPKLQASRAFKIIKEQKTSLVREHSIEIKNEKHWFNTKLMPLKIDHELKEFLCISRDITQEKNVQEQLINAEKLASLGTLAAGIAHEINNPLGIIIGFGELIMENTEKKSQPYQDLQLILKHALHCKKIVENLLNFARSKRDTFQETDINQAIKELLLIVKHTLNTKEIELETQLQNKLLLAKCDRSEIQQIFLNLIVNAIDAMPEGGKLTIRTWLEQNGYIKILFKDTGCGIKSKDIDKIFDPFFTTKPEGRGTGLGLSISYSIIRNYGGKIICESQINKGTKFTISLKPSRAKNIKEIVG